MKHSFITEKTKDGIEGTLSLRGDLTIGYVNKGKEAILDAMEGVDTLHLNLEGVEDADVALVQLICAAHREGLQREKKITLYEPGTVVGELLCNAGYYKQTGCPDGLKKQCLLGNAQLSC